jgi:hypothetical protein
MLVKDLKKQIESLPDDMEVYMRTVFNPCGNIVEAGSANKDTYGFFGKSIDCVIIEPEKFEDDEAPND